MNITSILITIVGIIFIIALYLMGRISKSKLPKIHTTLLPDIKDESGNKFTSILDDIPASDGSTPNPDKTKDKFVAEKASSSLKNSDSEQKNQQKQIVLFISAKDQMSLDGNLVMQALTNNGLTYGDKDIYHYFVGSTSGTSQNKVSLFRVANGVEPWTLSKNDLINKKIAGLSIVMFIPTVINNQDAIKILISTMEKLSNEINGVLKNQQQQILTDKDKESFISQ